MKKTFPSIFTKKILGEKLSMAKWKGKVHVVGICGTAMAGVALLFRDAGWYVQGSDTMSFPPMGPMLKSLGIPVLPFSAKNVDDVDVVVVGNAVRKDNEEVVQAQKLGKRIMSYPEAVKEFFAKGKEFFTVVGTHGKTSTTSMLAWTLEVAGLNPSFLVGGIPKNWGKNARFTDGDIFVIEGDEYDTAFFDKRPKMLHFQGKRAILNKVDFDHADIYKTREDYLAAFRSFVQGVKEKIAYLVCDENEVILKDLNDVEKVSWSEHDGKADFLVKVISETAGKVVFSILEPTGESFYTYLALIGKHYALNFCGVWALLRDMISSDVLQKSAQTFRGVKRRLEVIAQAKFDNTTITVIDDFAHHPVEVKAGLESLKKHFDFVICAFEPRSWTSRTKIHQEGFANSFSIADALFLGKVWKPEVIPEEKRMEPEKIVGYVRSAGKFAVHTENVADEILNFISSLSGVRSVAVVFMTSGDFYGEREKFLKNLEKLR